MTRSRILLEFMFMNLVIRFLLSIAYRILEDNPQELEGLIDKATDFAQALDQNYKELMQKAN